MSASPFSSLPLADELLTNLASLDYLDMTPIQAQSLPAILEGKDVIAQGQTGSGKTAAFGLGLLNTLDVKSFQVQALVICPTRELADQVANEIRRLARTLNNIKVLTLTGGTPLTPQATSLQHGVHIAVGTPGRIEDHLGKRTLQLGAVKTLVLDEADRMLDMGFQESIDKIIDQVPKQRQTLLFSATYPPQIQSITKRIMQQPVMIKVASTHNSASIEQHFYKISDEPQRLLALRLLLQQFQPTSTLVFCNTKVETQSVADTLRDYGMDVLALHGDMEQKDRDQTLIRFANNSASVLVATDVAARGLDIEALDMVVNYQVAHDPEIHLHRIGRTGRAGSKGIACSLYSDREEHKVAVLDAKVDPINDCEPLPPLNLLDKPVLQATMATLQIDGGKKQKLRPGDILGALTGENGINGTQVGKITLADNWCFVAVARDAVRPALQKLTRDKLKGRAFKVRLL